MNLDQDLLKDFACPGRSLRLTSRARDRSARRDATPPVVHLTAAPANDDIRVTWESTDNLAGVDDGACAIDVRTNGGAWEPHPVACAGAWDYGEPGHRYEFRFTAHDHVGNAASAVAQACVPSVTKYYYLGSQRVALRKDGAVTYLHPDHLGSTSLATDAAGNVVARRRYHPYGAERYVAGTLPTDVGYTGQRDVPGTGLMHYGARYYHPALGRFVSADTMVPEAGNPQALNRYAYVYNNPLRYVDPSGNVGIPALVVGVSLIGFWGIGCRTAIAHWTYPQIQGVRTTSANDAQFLSNLFTTDALGGDTPRARLQVILRGTASGALPGTYLRGEFGDEGFLPELQDTHDQVGHFLTGVGLACLLGPNGSIPMGIAVGHEMLGDDKFLSVGRQIYLGLVKHSEQIDAFRSAVAADAAGNIEERDALLGAILYARGKDPGAGNSLEDLRLTVRAFRFAQMMREGQFTNREAAAEWLQQNIGQ